MFYLHTVTERKENLWEMNRIFSSQQFKVDFFFPTFSSFIIPFGRQNLDFPPFLLRHPHKNVSTHDVSEWNFSSN